MMNGQYLKHDPHPVYLGVTLHRILSYKQHLTKVANKVKSNNNLLMKLAVSSWGANANTLQSLAFALCYSVAQYCCPVWAHSAHTDLVDVQLSLLMHLITHRWTHINSWKTVMQQIVHCIVFVHMSDMVMLTVCLEYWHCKGMPLFSGVWWWWFIRSTPVGYLIKPVSNVRLSVHICTCICTYARMSTKSVFDFN